MLQLTSLLFLVPAFEAYRAGLLLPSAVYTTNAVVSFAVHRPGRLPNFDWIDVIDHLCIGLWVAVNLSMVRLTPPFIPAILCAILVAAFR